MNSYTLVPRPSTGNWETVPVLNIDCQPWIQQNEISAWAQVCYDEDALYVRMQSIEPHIRAEESGPLAIVHEDSCMEFFFCPLACDPRYFNIEVNPKAAIHIAFGTNRHDSIRQVGKIPPIQPQVEKNADGWTLAYSIPYSFLRLYFPGFSPKAGDKMRANFYKCGDKTANPHYLCWNPIDAPNPDYHLSQFFGELVFG